MAFATGKKKAGVKDRPAFRNGWKNGMKEALDAALEKRGLRIAGSNSWKKQKAAHLW